MNTLVSITSPTETKFNFDRLTNSRNKNARTNCDRPIGERLFVVVVVLMLGSLEQPLKVCSVAIGRRASTKKNPHKFPNQSVDRFQMLSFI